MMNTASSIEGLRRRAWFAAGICAALVGSACEGNSGSGGTGDIEGDEEAPVAIVQFPPAGSLTDAELVTLVIAASDETGVASVRIAGSAATQVGGVWRVQVPLSEGSNRFSVLTQDTLGHTDPTAAEFTIRREGALWIDPDALAFDTLAGEALVLDPASLALVGVDPTSGRRTLRSGPGAGTGASFRQPRDLDFVASRHDAVVTDGELDAVVLVDLDSGTRTILSSPTVGGGPPPVDLHGIEVHAGLDRALVLDAGRAELLAVELASGARTTLSSNTLGTGPALDQARRLALDVPRGRVLVVQEPSATLLAIDLGTGNRTVFTGGTVGSGPELQAPVDLVIDPFQDRALVVDRAALALFEVELATGERRILSSLERGLGPSWLGPVAVTRHLGGVPLVMDAARDALLEVGALAGDRRIVTQVAIGSGPQLAQPSGLAVFLPGELGVADAGAVLSIGLASGNRTLISGAERGAGPDFRRLDDLLDLPLALCPHFFLTVDEALPGVWRIDAASGDRAVVSGDGVGAGPDFVRPHALTFELTPFELPPLGCPGNLFVLDRSAGGSGGAVLRVNVQTGERSILSDASRGAGPDWVDPVAIAGGAGGPFVLDAGLLEVVAVDPVTGDRREVSNGLPSGFASATDMVFDETQGLLLVVTTDPPAIWGIDPRIAGPTPVFFPLAGSGPALGRPEALVSLPSETVGSVAPTPIAFVLDSARACLLAVDASSGDRVIRAK